MFDLQVAGTGVTLEEIEVHLDATSDADFQLYTVLGGWQPVGSDPDAWTLNDSFSSVNVTQGLNSFDITDLFVAANTTLGFYFTTGGPTILNYRNGTGIGNVTATDGNLSILEGRGRFGLFEGSSSGARGFVGSVTYSLAETPGSAAIPLPTPALMLLVGLGAFAGVGRLRGRRA